MRKMVCLLMTLMSFVIASAQNGGDQFSNDSINQGVTIPLSYAEMALDSVALIGPIIPVGPGSPKSPARPRYVCLSGHTLYTFGQFDGYTLYIIREEEVVYAEEVFYEQPVITLPPVLSGTYTLVFADGDGRCYLGEITLWEKE